MHLRRRRQHGVRWGLDLSQTLEGARSTGSGPAAGGVGGLLSSASSSSFFAYDGNGNVVALVESSSGTVAAQYDYSPFGETVKATGPAADANPFRFSTKYADGPSPGPELYYYGLRYYNPGLGRWASRDPTGERGGWNIHGFVANSPTESVDPYGELQFKGPYAEANGYPYTEFVDKCQIGIFYGHYWSDDSHPGMQRLRVGISSTCARAVFIGCYTANQITSPAPLEGFTPPSSSIPWFGAGGAHGFVNNAKAAARAQADSFIASCCCTRVTIFVMGIALRPAGFLTPGDPDWGETIVVSPP